MRISYRAGQKGPLTKQDASARWNLKFHALCGIEAPVLFTLMVVVEGAIVPGYSQLSQPISDLGASSIYGSFAYLQNLNFWAFGVLVLTFAVGLGIALPGSGAASNTLALFGILAFTAGLFQDQPNPYPGSVHAVVSIAAFVLVIASQFLLWRRLRHSAAEERAVWGRHGTYSLVSGVVSVVFLLVFILGLPQPSPYYGVGQRLFIAVPWVWIGVTAYLLYRSESNPNRVRPTDSPPAAVIRNSGGSLPRTQTPQAWAGFSQRTLNLNKDS